MPSKTSYSFKELDLSAESHPGWKNRGARRREGERTSALRRPSGRYELPQTHKINGCLPHFYRNLSSSLRLSPRFLSSSVSAKLTRDATKPDCPISVSTFAVAAPAPKYYEKVLMTSKEAPVPSSPYCLSEVVFRDCLRAESRTIPGRATPRRSLR